MFINSHQFIPVVLPTVACGHPIKVYQTKTSRPGWKLVKTVGVEGYIQSNYLRPRQVKCFQDRYPKFFDSLELSITDMYYLGRLSDLYIRGKSKVRQ